MRELSTSTAMPGSVTTENELTSSEYLERLIPYVRRAISTTRRRSASGRGRRRCQCERCERCEHILSDPSIAANTKIWQCCLCGHAGCSREDRGGAMEHSDKFNHRFVMRIATDRLDDAEYVFQQTEIWDYLNEEFLKISAFVEPELLPSTNPVPFMRFIKRTVVARMWMRRRRILKHNTTLERFENETQKMKKIGSVAGHDRRHVYPIQ
ncbi:hypothetical protein BGZ57DRAFT_310102 [Hyaloscypha finlandica]|nr:hypothetical protein BGZ57DRAFT_310102 [Hyaloscypha finlandica]